MKKPESGSGAGGVVQGRDLTRRKTADDVGIIGLPAAVIALANEGGRDGIEESGAKAAGALIEITGVLVKYRLRHYMADQDAADATPFADQQYAVTSSRTPGAGCDCRATITHNLGNGALRPGIVSCFCGTASALGAALRALCTSGASSAHNNSARFFGHPTVERPAISRYRRDCYRSLIVSARGTNYRASRSFISQTELVNSWRAKTSPGPRISRVSSGFGVSAVPGRNFSS